MPSLRTLPTDLRLFAKYHLKRRVYDHPEKETDLGVVDLGFDLDAFVASMRSVGDRYEVRTLTELTYRDRSHPVLCAASTGTHARRTVVILGGVHGNEHAGILAVPEILARVDEPAVRLVAIAPVNPVKSAAVSAELSLRARLLGAGFVLAAVVFQALWLGLPAVFLSVALVLSYGLWVGSSWHMSPRLRIVFAFGVLLFLGHAAEELLTGFHQALPALFGGQRWSEAQFLVFNGVWALVFGASAIAVRPGRSLPVLVILFFAVAGGVGNGVLHLLLVLQRGAYFPGAWTAPLCLAIGIWLLRLLYASEVIERCREDR